MKIFRPRSFHLLGLAMLCHSGLLAAETTGDFNLDVRRRQALGDNGGATVLFAKERINPAKTAVVVIDMWDQHWCKTYTARVANLVPRMNQTIAAARKLGLQIVWAPSDVANFYRDYPQRQAMQAIPTHPAPAQIAFDPPQVPQGDYCECGPDQPCKEHKRVWTRQQANLVIAADDLIADTNNARELLNLCAERGIDTLIYLGVASNMCVCYRDMGMIRMRRYGFRTRFVSDQVESIMANGFNPATKSPDPNFTPAKGSALVQQFLEQHVAPSFESRQLLARAGLAASGNDQRPLIVFVLGDEEYQTGETLPAFARQHLERIYRCTFLPANPGDRNDIPGLSALYDADLLVLSMRRRFLPVPQMDHLERFIRSGKPLVTIRVGVAAFAESGDLRRKGDGLVVWQNFDQEILGCHYNFYDSAARKTGSDVWSVAAQAGHPVLRGLADLRFHSSAWIYRVAPLTPDATVLLMGRWSDSQPAEPVAWTRDLPDRGRVFYTSLGHPDDFKQEKFQVLLANAIRWALGSPSDQR